MQQTLKQNSHPKATASNRNGVQSLASLAKAAKKKATKRKNGKTITLGTSDSNVLVNARNKATVARTTRKPRKFVHVAPKATASEIARNLGIDSKTYATVRQIIRDLEMKGKL